MAIDLGVVGLQLDDPLARALLELVGLVELGVGRLVEAVEIALSHAFGGDVLADVEQVLDQHPERPTPVADVVLAHDVVAEEPSISRTSASPITVVRRWPACISLATLGAE